MTESEANRILEKSTFLPVFEPENTVFCAFLQKVSPIFPNFISTNKNLSKQAARRNIPPRRCLLFDPNIHRAPACALFYYLSVRYEFAKRGLQRACAQRRAQPADLRFREFSEPRLHRFAHRFQRGQLVGNEFHPLFKITICRDDRAQKVFDKRHGVLLPFPPAVLRCRQSVVIQLFVVRNLRLQRNVFSSHIPVLIQ